MAMLIKLKARVLELGARVTGKSETKAPAEAVIKTMDKEADKTAFFVEGENIDPEMQKVEREAQVSKTETEQRGIEGDLSPPGEEINMKDGEAGKIPASSVVEKLQGEQEKGKIGGEGVKQVRIPEPPKPASLSDVEARIWYLESISKIPYLIDKTQSLEHQARQAFEFRNLFRTQTRAAMINRAKAAFLDKIDPNLTWEQVVKKYESQGLKGDALFEEIIIASTRSRTSINRMLGID